MGGTSLFALYCTIAGQKAQLIGYPGM